MARRYKRAATKDFKKLSNPKTTKNSIGYPVVGGGGIRWRGSKRYTVTSAGVVSAGKGPTYKKY